MLMWILYSCLAVLVFSLVIVLPLGTLLLFVKWRTKWDKSPICLVGKTVIVTGANSGIGFYTAREFAKRGARVILACRNMVRAERAKRKIVEETENSNIHVRIIDFVSFKSVRDFAREIYTTEERLDILVNNAGGLFNDETTIDGLSKTMQVNSLGPFLLTFLMLDLLNKAKPSRIVNVSSSTIYFATVDINNLNSYSHSSISRAFFYNYANSKLCNLVLTNEMARGLRGANLTINSVNPFLVFTDIGRDWNVILSILYACRCVIKYFIRSCEEGAQSSIFVSLSRNIEQVTGKYFENSVITAVPDIANDEAFAKELWNKCVPLLRLTEEERLSIQKVSNQLIAV